MARDNLLHITYHLVIQRMMGSDEDYRHLGVYEGDRAMFHLGGRVSFGMDVGDFLELQGAFEGDWIVPSTTEVEEVAGVCEHLRKLLDLVVLEEDLLYLLWDEEEFLDGGLVLFLGYCTFCHA